MKTKKFAVQAAVAGALGAAALGPGAGLAQADPHGPPRPPWIPGPGVNAGAPGNPLSPGQGYLPSPGHRGVIDDVIPVWAPPPPPRCSTATGSSPTSPPSRGWSSK